LRDVASIELVCQPELMPFYRRWGFSEQVGRSRLMRRTSDAVLVSAAAQQAPLANDSAQQPRLVNAAVRQATAAREPPRFLDVKERNG
jgi:hypothetical protein